MDAREFNITDIDGILTLQRTSRKHARVMYTPLNPTFIYSKTGVCRGIPIFLIFAPKTEAVLTCTHNLCFEQK